MERSDPAISLLPMIETSMYSDFSPLSIAARTCGYLLRWGDGEGAGG
jgi:hypothetical protein